MPESRSQAPQVVSALRWTVVSTDLACPEDKVEEISDTDTQDSRPLVLRTPVAIQYRLALLKTRRERALASPAGLGNILLVTTLGGPHIVAGVLVHRRIATRVPVGNTALLLQAPVLPVKRVSIRGTVECPTAINAVRVNPRTAEVGIHTALYVSLGR